MSSNILARKNAALFADIVIEEKGTTKQEELYIKLTFTKSILKCRDMFQRSSCTSEILVKDSKKDISLERVKTRLRVATQDIICQLVMNERVAFQYQNFRQEARK